MAKTRDEWRQTICTIAMMQAWPQQKIEAVINLLDSDRRCDAGCGVCHGDGGCGPGCGCRCGPRCWDEGAAG